MVNYSKLSYFQHQILLCQLQCHIIEDPVSSGIGPQSLPEWAFRALGFGGFAFALKLPELLNTNLPTVRANIFFP